LQFLADCVPGHHGRQLKLEPIPHGREFDGIDYGSSW
jgi:hypothetical protein